MHLSLRDIECGVLIKFIQSRDVTLNENAMLSFGKESIASSTGTGDRE